MYTFCLGPVCAEIPLTGTQLAFIWVAFPWVAGFSMLGVGEIFTRWRISRMFARSKIWTLLAILLIAMPALAVSEAPWSDTGAYYDLSENSNTGCTEVSPRRTVTVGSGQRTPKLKMGGVVCVPKMKGFAGTGLDFDGSTHFLTSTLQTGTADSNTLNKLVDSGGGFSGLVEVGDVAVDTDNDDQCVVTAVDSDTALSLDGDCFAAGSEAYDVQSGYFNITAAITVGAWIRPTDVTSVSIVSKDDNTLKSYKLGIDGSSNAFFTIYDSNAAKTATSSITLVASNAYFIVGTYDGANVLVSVSGATATTAYSGNIDDDSVQLEVGRRGDGAEDFDGVIDNVFVLSRAWNTGQIQSFWHRLRAWEWYAKRGSQ